MKIIHIDMDMFFAAVEIRDNPELAGKPLIIGALPGERGVVSTCSYEARAYGVRSAMSIAEAYRLCPEGIYMHPQGHKYVAASREIMKIWYDYTDLVECISLDEAFLDVTGSEHLFGGTEAIGREIKRRVREETGLTCSVGIGYSMMSAKLASEEKKPDGFFEILTPKALREMITPRNVRIIYGLGAKTALELARLGITTVRDIYESKQAVINLLGNHGRQIIALAEGIDNRRVTPNAPVKSIGNEHTFQQDIGDFDYLRDVLLLIARKLSFDLQQQGIYCRTVTIKVTYPDMKQITRSKSGEATDKAAEIYSTAAALLDKIEKRSVRLIGMSLSGLCDAPGRQMTLFDAGEEDNHGKLADAMLKLQLKYGRGIIKTANEIRAEKRVWGED
jgi:DNA polymerase-4/DNA polymerase IV (DinB-like DNA polymerase)